MKVQFVAAEPGHRLYVHHEPAVGVTPRGGIVHVHAFGEEMNKSRNVVARQARALSERGWHVLLVDLMGCGDSSGDFGDATWDRWLADVDTAVATMQREGNGTVCLWGLRAGALLAADWTRSRASHAPLVLWQPVLSGRQYLQQLLRLRMAGQLVGKGDQRELAGDLRARLFGEGALEIAGYSISSALARGIERCDLSPLPQRNRVLWLEVSSRSDPTLGPASLATIDALHAIGCDVTAKPVSGPAFWASAYLEECPELIAATTAVLADARSWTSPATAPLEQSSAGSS